MRRALILAVLTLFLSIGAHASEERISVRGDVHVNEGETVDTAASVFGNVFVDGEVVHSAASLFGNVTIGSSGRVGGDAVSLAGSVIRVNGATVSGKIRNVSTPATAVTKMLFLGLPTAAATLAIVGTVVAVASSIGFIVLVTLILVLFAPQVIFAREIMAAAPFRSLSIGFLGFLALLPLTIFLTVTIIGIPLAFAIAAIIMAAICLGSVAGCEWLGSELCKSAGKTLSAPWRGLLGLAALFLVGLIPVIGALVHAITVLTGLGAVAQSRFRAGNR